MRTQYTRTCPVCEETFQTYNPQRRYCTDRCNKVARFRRHGKPSVLVARICVECQASYIPKHGTQRFCSFACRDTCNARTTNYTSIATSLDSGKVGAVGELLVSVDLLRRGYEVFRAISASASCDLIAMRDTTMLRIEVRATYTLTSGTTMVPYQAKDHGRQDIMATITAPAIVRYWRPTRTDGGVSVEEVTL